MQFVDQFYFVTMGFGDGCFKKGRRSNSNSCSKINKLNKQATYRKTFAVLISLYINFISVIILRVFIVVELVLFVVVWGIKEREREKKKNKQIDKNSLLSLLLL